MDRRELISQVITQLELTLQQRKQADPNTSYTATLLHKGTDTILKKLAEETAELILAAKNNNQQNIIHETADLLYHIQVLLTQQNIPIEDIYKELQRREGISGLTEKENRKK
ncbi:MAG: phosphoribosyl-ATP diphosphatase [Methylacidiphilales bacterium]|nr:phosphoribosyl-ATP diphosphatase [Candidatus Methylacidiphilales bacterium]